ncbi:U1 small nuclear ribonucleoprotein C [Coemansia sp. RSA 2703]|nr:U1 small nuclear ribonucleoprotein C [Coemansia sp. RSA 2703]KAJ2368754.1 U1 small nuclear ribonucleoprotein C [Coemansia sp. RSA 2607]
MPRYYCDYCDIFLTHDSSSVRQAHNSGWKHVNQVAAYYRNLPAEKIQSVVDTLERAYSGQEMPELPKVAPPTYDAPQRFGRPGGARGGRGGRGRPMGRPGSYRQRSQSPGNGRGRDGRGYRQGGQQEGYAAQGTQYQSQQQYGGGYDRGNQHNNGRYDRGGQQYGGGYERGDRQRYSQAPPPPGPALSAPPQIHNRDRDSRGRSGGRDWDR